LRRILVENTHAKIYLLICTIASRDLSLVFRICSQDSFQPATTSFGSRERASKWMGTHEKIVSTEVVATANDGPIDPNKSAQTTGICFEGTDTKDNSATAERRIAIYQSW
jgi:hypothetical protein